MIPPKIQEQVLRRLISFVETAEAFDCGSEDCTHDSCDLLRTMREWLKESVGARTEPSAIEQAARAVADLWRGFSPLTPAASAAMVALVCALDVPVSPPPDGKLSELHTLAYLVRDFRGVVGGLINALQRAGQRTLWENTMAEGERLLRTTERYADGPPDSVSPHPALNLAEAGAQGDLTTRDQPLRIELGEAEV